MNDLQVFNNTEFGELNVLIADGKESRYMTYIGKRVTVTFPHYGRIQRVLCQDWQGLYVKYKGHRVSVRPERSGMGEVLPGYYIGLHPKLMK